jgi:hypothetical protein
VISGGNVPDKLYSQIVKQDRASPVLEPAKVTSTGKDIVRKVTYGPKQNVRRQKQKLSAVTDHKTVVNAVKSYQFTEAYRSVLLNLPTDQRSLDKVNHWIKINKRNIDPTFQHYCKSCGDVDFELCVCSIAVAAEPLVSLAPFVSERYKHTGVFTDGTLKQRSIDFDQINNHNIGNMGTMTNNWFHPNRPVVSDSMIDEEMYNYLCVNQHVKYPSRALKLEHTHRLALKYLKTIKVDDAQLTSREAKIMALTISRATDQVEMSYLYGETDPNFKRPFLSALLVFVVGFLINCALALSLLVCLTISISQTLFWYPPLAIILVSLRTLLLGSVPNYRTTS